MIPYALALLAVLLFLLVADHAIHSMTEPLDDGRITPGETQAERLRRLR